MTVLVAVLVRMMTTVALVATLGKSTKTRMKIHFHTNRNFPGGYPYDPHGYYDGLFDVPSCLHGVLDDVPWHWLVWSCP